MDASKLITEHYNRREKETDRLQTGMGLLEYLRTMDILARRLPPPPAVVLDIGGGPGAYAVPLTRVGYTVHLLDLVPLHISQARIRAQRAGVELASAETGDATALPFGDEVADAVLLMGPLYHLQDEDARQEAVREAFRVAKPGACLVAAGISRYASALDGMLREMLTDPAFAEVVEEDLESGMHHNPNDDPRYFTTAFFHEPGQLESEIISAGWTPEGTVAVEGPAGLLSDVPDRLRDPARRELLMGILRRLERVPALIGASWHHLALASKP